MKPSIELHEGRMIICAQCHEQTLVHLIEGKAVAGHCPCGYPFGAEQVQEGCPVWWFDCDSCGEEIISPLYVTDLDDNGNLLPEGEIDVMIPTEIECPCGQRYQLLDDEP